MKRQRRGNTALWLVNPDEDNTFVCDKNTAAYKLLTKSRTVTIVLDDACSTLSRSGNPNALLLGAIVLIGMKYEL